MRNDEASGVLRSLATARSGIPAEVLRSTPRPDLAILRMAHCDDIPVARLGRSGDLVAGEEVIYVTEGEVRFHLDDGGAPSSATVAAPNYFVVPAGVWHTADALGTARLLVITWGEGTQNRPR